MKANVTNIRIEDNFFEGDEEEVMAYLVQKTTETKDCILTVDCKPGRYTCSCTIVADVVSAKFSITGSCS